MLQTNILSFIDDVTPRASTLRRKNTGEISRLSILGGKNFVENYFIDLLLDEPCGGFKGLELSLPEY